MDRIMARIGEQHTQVLPIDAHYVFPQVPVNKQYGQ